jgi:hypothetical protein
MTELARDEIGADTIELQGERTAPLPLQYCRLNPTQQFRRATPRPLPPLRRDPIGLRQGASRRAQCSRPRSRPARSMNTVAEYFALHNLGYEQVPRSVPDRKAQQIREQIKELSDLKYCAETFKHVRKIKDHHGSAFTTIATSTGVASDDQTTWQIDQYDLVNVLQRAFATLGEILELK